MDAMNHLESKRFFQRMWTRLDRDFNIHGKATKMLVGGPPARIPVRTVTQRKTPGPDDAFSDMVINVALQGRFETRDLRYINAEELKPAYVPNLYGGETIVGGQKPGHVDQAGLLTPDDVTKNVILGNQNAKLNWIPVSVHSPSSWP